jgi:hypothetical protein
LRTRISNERGFSTQFGRISETPSEMSGASYVILAEIQGLGARHTACEDTYSTL